MSEEDIISTMKANMSLTINFGQTPYQIFTSKHEKIKINNIDNNTGKNGDKRHSVNVENIDMKSPLKNKKM